MDNSDRIFVMCKETNCSTGECIVYDIGFADEKNINLGFLEIRARYNPELEYYVMLESVLEFNKEYIISLIKKGMKSTFYIRL